MTPAVIGATVWLIILGLGLAWLLVVLGVHRDGLFGPRAIVRWLLGSWPSRLTLLILWGMGGWHVFCQRP